MPYITREDGEHFVIPSYRDVLSAKNKGQFKKDILLLSQSYGEYITLQKKNAMQYEIAFSPDLGYLLGETVWQHFNKPEDMVYCEAIPGSEEVILVIVKDNSVYLDGSFPTENVSEELVVFLTQQAHFEIYTYGDVPIADSPEDGKFSFDVKSVKSFTRLDNAVFPTLPLIPAYKLQLVDAALKAQGIGVLPIIPVVAVVVIAGLGWYLWTSMNKQPVQQVATVTVVNPYQNYINEMYSPLPDLEVLGVVSQFKNLLLIPGWQINTMDYRSGQITSKLTSNGGTVEGLYAWCGQHEFTCAFDKKNFAINVKVDLKKVDRSNLIYSLDEVFALFFDKLSRVYPGNHLKIGSMKDDQVYKEVDVTITLDDFAPLYIALIGKQLANLPFVVQGMKGTVDNGTFHGTISLTALGK